jgi:hypothetical protein
LVGRRFGSACRGLYDNREFINKLANEIADAVPATEQALGESPPYAAFFVK